MSFAVAVQSAVFYYLACTPCMAARQRYRTRRRARAEREERARRVEEQPDIYRHPSPFNMNPYWEEEMSMGPHLAKKGKAAGGKDASQRGLASAGKEGSVGTASSLAISTSNGAGAAHAQESPTLVPDDTRSISVVGSTAPSTADTWNYKRYQREDEELWGHELSRTGQKLMDAIVKAGSSAGRLIESTLGKERQVTDEDRANFYTAPINPPVNDYHPPVVGSKPVHKDALRWMLQPPPPAKVMEGKVPVSRSTSVVSSVGRRTVVGSEASLGRSAREKPAEARLGRGELSVEAEKLLTVSPARPASRRTTASSRTRSQRRARSGSLSTESDASSEGGHRRRRQAHPPAATPGVGSEDEDGDCPTPTAEAHAAQRPRLETIFSSDASSRAAVGGRRAGKKEKMDAPGSVADRARRSVLSDPSPVKERATESSVDSGLALSA